MFEHVKVTGEFDSWIAVPKGYAPTEANERIATGSAEALAMFREANTIIGKLPKQPKSDPINLVVFYSAVLLNDAQHGRAIKAEVEKIGRKGDAVGVACTTTTKVRPAR